MTHTFDALDAEWRSLSSGRAATQALRRWALVEPALAFPTLANLMDQRRLSAADGQEILGALARLASADRLAARTLLQAIIPGIANMTRTFRSGNADIDADLVAIAWERIRTYPTHRPGSVAANVLFDVRKRYCQRLRRDRAARELAAAPVEVLTPEELVVQRDDSCLKQLANARDRGLISSCALRAIVRSRIDDDSLEEVAADENLSVRNLVLRRWRGERALRRHLDPFALAG